MYIGREKPLEKGRRLYCPWCRKRLYHPVKKIDYYCEQGYSEKIEAKLRERILEMIRKIDYPTEGVPGLENM